MIPPCHAQEPLECFQVGGYGEVVHSLSLVLNSSGRHKMSEKFQRGLEQFAFFHVDRQASTLEFVKNGLDIVEMLFPGLGENYDVVQVHETDDTLQFS